MKILDNLKIKIFADGADQNSIKKLNEKNILKDLLQIPHWWEKLELKIIKVLQKKF